MRLLLLLGMFLWTAQLSWAGTASSAWQSFRFDGSGFSEASGEDAIWVRDGYLPVVAGTGAPREDPLPQGTGGIALLCFQQVSGGKLRPQAGFRAVSGAALHLRLSALNLAARADANGYVILAVPAGSYQVKLQGLTKQIKVVQGKNALTSFRIGKRMVD